MELVHEYEVRETELLYELENILTEEPDSKTDAKARIALRNFLSIELDESDAGKNFAELLAINAKQQGSKSKLKSAVLIRCLMHPAIFSEGSNGSANDRFICDMVEKNLPELCNIIQLKSRKQTYEKITAIADVHLQVDELLRPFVRFEPDIDYIVAQKNAISRALNDKLVKHYCLIFGWQNVRAGWETLSSKLDNIKSDQSELTLELDEVRTFIESQYNFCRANPSYLISSFYKPLLKNAEVAVEKFVTRLKGRFLSDISARLSTEDALQKKFPLHEVGRRISLAIPLRNTGPGQAVNTQVSIEADDVNFNFENQILNLGSLPSGDFSAVFDAEILNPMDSASFMVSINWQEYGSPNVKRHEFLVTAFAQKSDIDWAALQFAHPYSTEVAKGDKFVGRAEKISMLASKIIRTPMESFYVTGQKRIGKTSLVLATAEHAEKNSGAYSIESQDILWGAIANADAEKSLSALGTEILNFIYSFFPENIVRKNVEFDGSLSPLIEIAREANKILPNKKFVIIIDEFDEIHPELYQHGNLAETFFANIRALTTCDNIAIILVGGENMPYVMDRQGQKLNKMVRSPLDYFSRETEWEDFKLLVTQPTVDQLDWHDDAISEIFNQTRGNPYFAKIVCGAIFTDCIQERDSDITNLEVTKALSRQVAAFDSNQFAHLWQDGVPKAPAEREPDILRRCRLLAAISRVLRKDIDISTKSLVQNMDGINLDESEVQMILNDFVKRGVLFEVGDAYDFGLPIFKNWLLEVGGSRLISDTLGEELALQVQTAEDEAFINSKEVTELANEWPTYQGQSITADHIRAWYQQVDSQQDQRLLFKILQNLQFLGDEEVRDRVKNLHSQIRNELPEFVQRKRRDRRNDVWITYLDGEGKSGQSYASKYADVNKISAKSIISPSIFEEKANELVSKTGKPAVLLILDDIIGTGGSMTTNLREFVQNNLDILKSLNVPITIMSLVSTTDGDEQLRAGFEEWDWLDIDCKAFEFLTDQYLAFADGLGIWRNQNEKDRAAALVKDLGSQIYSKSPLGFGNQGLMLVFPENCPNNSIPILHSTGKGKSDSKWKPLFARSVH